jgi:glycosyltransferase involved in cell wall biosynthesis
MRILLDYRPALRQRTGVGEWVHELGCSLLQLRRSGEPLARDLELAVWTASLRDRPSPAARTALDGAAVIDRRIPVRALVWAWNRLAWPPVETLAGRAFDVVHSTTPLLVPQRSGLRVCTIYDLDFLSHPERTWGEMHRDFPALARLHAQRADLVVTISEYSSRQIQARLGVPADRICVCRPGVPHWVGDEGRGAPARDGYILFVGTLEPRKNVGGLLDAYERLLAAWPSAPNLVLAGGFSQAASSWIERAKMAPLAGHVELRGYVSDDNRIALYRGAAMLVLPSFDEGFGLPALEAMALGVPVIAADRGALPEVVGRAGLLAAPDDAGAWSVLMQRVLTDQGLAESLRSDGFARSREFQWAEAARSLLAAFEQRRHAGRAVRRDAAGALR